MRHVLENNFIFTRDRIGGMFVVKIVDEWLLLLAMIPAKPLKKDNFDYGTFLNCDDSPPYTSILVYRVNLPWL